MLTYGVGYGLWHVCVCGGKKFGDLETDETDLGSTPPCLDLDIESSTKKSRPTFAVVS